MDYCNKCGGDPDEVGELTEWRTMNVCKSCLVNEPDYALFLEEVNEALRADVERLTAECDELATELHARHSIIEDLQAERDALARRMRVVEFGTCPVPDHEGGFVLDCSEADGCVVDAILDFDDACGTFPTASAALDAAADALEKAGILPKE